MTKLIKFRIPKRFIRWYLVAVALYGVAYVYYFGRNDGWHGTIGWMGGMVMFLLLEHLDDKNDKWFSDWDNFSTMAFWVFLATTLMITINMALTSLGILQPIE